jgi:hypothetical protein
MEDLRNERVHVSDQKMVTEKLLEDADEPHMSAEMGEREMGHRDPVDPVTVSKKKKK